MLNKMILFLKYWHIYFVLKKSGMFDREYYLRNNVDVARECCDPIRHFVCQGWRESRNPSRRFNTSWYLEKYPDVAKAGINPLYHFITQGIKEHRVCSPNYCGEDIYETTEALDCHAQAIYDEISVSAADPQSRAIYQDNRDFSGNKTDVKLIAFYLPQFHEIPENNKWWGDGFTEWTNTRKAEPVFCGHYQPREPHSDIGYYDLSDVEVMRKQAELAKQHGIYGFCFYHYWFNGKRLLEKPVDQLLARPDIDIKFCLCWANENWTRSWDGRHKDVLIAQNHDRKDDVEFIRDLARYMRDPRYIRVNGKPVILVYRPKDLPQPDVTFGLWRDWCVNNGIGEIHIVCSLIDGGIPEFHHCVDAVFDFPPNSPLAHPLKRVNRMSKGIIFDYAEVVANVLSKLKNEQFPLSLYPSIMLHWDNTPRRSKDATVYDNFSIAAFSKWLQGTISYAKKQLQADNRFVFINAWNEWAEGTYLEPDRKYGYCVLNALSSQLFSASITHGNSNKVSPKNKTILFLSHDANLGGAQVVLLSILKWMSANVTDFSLKVLTLSGGNYMGHFKKYADVLVYSDIAKFPTATKVVKIKEFCGNSIAFIYGNSVASCRIYSEISALKVPIITHVHELQKSIEHYAGEETVRQMLAHTQKYIACSKAVEQNLLTRHKISAQKIEMVCSFIDHGSPVPDAIKKRELRRRFQIPENATVVIGSGLGLFWRKGADLFIEVARKLVNAGIQEICFIWLGSFSDDGGNHKYGSWNKIYSALNADTRLKSKVRFVGMVPDITDYLNAGDVFLLPSREDPFPLVCLEAARASLPIICFDGAGGMPDFVEDDAGFVVAYEDTQAMADKLKFIIQHPANMKSLGLKAREKFLLRHTTEIAVPSIFNICKNVAKLSPRVSVVVPVYNGQRFLEKRMDSILSQDFKDFEIIIIDDSSKDGSLMLARQYLKFPEVRVLQNDSNQGVFRTWLKGISEARGDIVWIAEQDDLCESNFLSKLVPAFDDDRMVMAYCNSSVIDEKNNVTPNAYLRCGWYEGLRYPSSRWTKNYCNSGKAEVLGALAIKNTVPNASAVLVRRSMLMETDMSRIGEFYCGGDWYLYLKLLEKGDIFYCSEELNYHRRHTTSVVTTNASDYKRTLTDYYLNHKYIVDKYDVDQELIEKMSSVASGLRHLWPKLTDSEFNAVYDVNSLYAKKTADKAPGEICSSGDLTRSSNSGEYPGHKNRCSVCGGNEYERIDVLWPELIKSWQLLPYEVDYINRQQGESCIRCHNNLRSISLAKGILDSYGFPGSLTEFVASPVASNLKVLEINEAGCLTPILKKLPGYKFVAYPEFDMMNLKLADASFDLVIHSDTLEHIKDPVKALSECKRVLTNSGRCIFTIPVVVDRLSKSRVGLEPSYHGPKNTTKEGYMVHTEFGGDFWKCIYEAGFTKCRMHSLVYPAAFAIEASC